jgi:YHS domain-containing protein
MERMTRAILAAALLSLAGAGSLSAAGEDPGNTPRGNGAEAAAVSAESWWQMTCPVMGNPVDPGVFTDHDGRRVYFCCPPCVERFMQDPETFIQKIEEQGILLEKSPQPQLVCPVTGRGIDKNIYIDHEGRRVYLCCRQCVETFKSDPESFVTALLEQGVTLEEIPEDSAAESAAESAGE